MKACFRNFQFAELERNEQLEITIINSPRKRIKSVIIDPKQLARESRARERLRFRELHER